MLKSMIGAVCAGVTAVLTMVAIPATAQDMSAADAALFERQMNPKEVVLTEDQVKRFAQLAAAEKAARAKHQRKYPDSAPSTRVNMARITREAAELETLPPKFGFDSKGDYIDIQWTINKLWPRIDPETGTFKDPSEDWKKRISETEAEPLDGKSPDEIEDHRRNIADMKGYLDDPFPRKPENIALVTKYIKDLIPY
jgi:hypothetical protein